MLTPFEEKSPQTLELPKVIDRLCDFCSFEQTAQQLRALRPTDDAVVVRLELDRVENTLSLKRRFSLPIMGRMEDVEPILKRAAKGALLSPRELLLVVRVLQGAKALSEYYHKVQDEGVLVALDFLFEELWSNPELTAAIKNAILSEDEISDTASEKLFSIRRKMRQNEQKIRASLDKLIHSSSTQKYLQDSLVTMRDGRFVVPVRSEYRQEVKGLVHDTSASGATLFIEPLSVVELGNESKVLEGDEKAEIERILSELSAQVDAYHDAILHSYQVIIELDGYFAKAKYADFLDATKPQVVEDGRVHLNEARHPLIDPAQVVPVTIYLGEGFDTLIITGPNTGGKTVTLKTLGLLTLMTMCGLLIPVKEHSVVSVFDSVLADIGDEQSIEQNLSTFSAHMTNIVEILRRANPGSLVLLDELGAGTDPVEGAALAISIIEKLRRLHAKVAATTHYAEIKVFALETQGVENASCEFDVQTLRPTYRLLIGVPGRSNAFAIAGRLGLEGPVIEHAQSLISKENTRFEEVVSQLEQARQELEKEREQTRINHDESEMLRRKAEEKLRALNAEKEKELEKARGEARRLVSDVRESAQQIMDELDELRRQKDQADFGNLAVSAKTKLRQRLKALEDKADPVKKTEGGGLQAKDIHVGDAVELIDIDKAGTVLSLPDASGYVQVQAGIIKTRVPLSNLRKGKKNSRSTTVGGTSMRKVSGKETRSAATSVDIRGMNVEEGIMELDRFIDNSVIMGVPSITIVHGKGTGVLRKGIHAHLRGHKNVRTFRLGTYGEGEDGVTIVELK